MHQIQYIFSAKSQGVTRILFPLLNTNHLTTSENHIASYLSVRTEAEKNLKGIMWTDITYSFLLLMHPFVLRTISILTQRPPPAFPLCTHPLMRRAALCNVLGCSSGWPPHCTFGERMNINVANSGCVIQ